MAPGLGELVVRVIKNPEDHWLSLSRPHVQRVFPCVDARNLRMVSISPTKERMKGVEMSKSEIIHLFE